MQTPSYQDWLIVVPARRASTRLPDKPLQDVKGKPLIVRVVENLNPLVEKGASLVVAVDDQEILTVCQDHGIKAELTDRSHRSGTDRCAEIARSASQKFIVNVQGDEPCLSVTDLENMLLNFRTIADDRSIGTLAFQSTSLEDFKNPNVCKLVLAANGDALYFSRSPVPFGRDSQVEQFWQHIGVYCFTRVSLQYFCQLPPGALEQIEQLEQLRALEAKMRIHVTRAKHLTHGVDTPEDLERVRALY